jgi:hypothetical protein
MMSAMLESTPVELREAFLELSMGDGDPDPETLDALIRRLPQYAQELTDFAIDLVIVGMADEDETFVVAETAALSAEAASALSVFQNALFDARKNTASDTVTAPATIAAGPVGEVENPFAHLDRAGMRAIASGLQATPIFVGKLRDRIILADTMTDGFMRRCAELLGVSMQGVVSHFWAPQAVMLGRQNFKADGKPVVGGKQTFEEALQNAGLDAEQQSYLRSL